MLKYEIVRRSPRGERGLKSAIIPLNPHAVVSLPSRGAWIEIESTLYRLLRGKCRSPRGERGLKYPTLLLGGKRYNVAPLAGSVD